MKILAVISTLAKDVERLNEAIESLNANSSSHEFEILVVNNSEQFEIAGLSPVDHIISPGINLGYVGGLELARRTFDSDFLWSIQDDMTVDNDVLGLLLSEMEKSPRLAVCSPVLVRSGLVPARTRAGIFTNAQETRWENYPIADLPADEIPNDVKYSFVSGSGALFRNSALEEIGGFNLDLYPLMHVDVDVCARFISMGWQISLVTEAHIRHRIQGSTPGILAKALDRRNRSVVEQQLEGSPKDDYLQSDQIDPGIIFAVARRASFLFLEVSREANSQLEAKEGRISELESQLRGAQRGLQETLAELDEIRLALETVQSKNHKIQESWSWTITAPLRALGRILHVR